MQYFVNSSDARQEFDADEIVTLRLSFGYIFSGDTNERIRIL